MSFLISMGNSAPSTTEAVFGMTNDYKSFNLNLAVSTPEQKEICQNFFTVVGGHSSVNIINSEWNFEDCCYIVVSGVDEQIVVVDYISLSNSDKEKISKFANLVTEIAQ